MSAARTVSVALCTFNGERFLREQLDSILAQSVLPDELIVSDDGSTDGSVSIAEEFAVEAAERGLIVRILRNASPLGVSSNFEQALRNTTGEVVFLSDQDDRWHSDHVADLLGGLARQGTLLVHADAHLVDGDGVPRPGGLFHSIVLTRKERRRMRHGDYLPVLVRRNTVTGATVALDATLLEEALPIGDGWVHDEWLAAVAAVVGRVALSPRATVDYRQHGGNEIGAGERSIRVVLDKVLGVRDDRSARLARRVEVLIQRMAERGDVSAETLDLLARKREMELWRSRLPENRARRVLPVLARAITGAYARFCSRGNGDVMRDIFQRASRP